jgi:peptide chain release factor subunit 1
MRGSRLTDDITVAIPANIVDTPTGGRCHMRASEDVLRELAGFAETGRSILSSYLDIRGGWAATKAFVERESQRLRPLLGKDEKDYFETSVSFMWDSLNEKKAGDFSDPGIAFFADLGRDYTRGVDLYASPEPLLAIDQEAVIYPLALQLDEYEPVGVIMVDASCMRILIAAGEVIESEDSLCERIHHLSKVGGWSQMRYQRRRAKEVKHFSKEVLEEAKDVFDPAGVRRIVVAGRDRMITALEQELPQEWRERIIATIRWDLDSPDKDFLEKVRPYLEKKEREQEADLLSLLIGELRRGGLAAAGPEPTARALEIGQVDTLLVSTGLATDTAESLIHRAEPTGTHVEFVPQGNEVLEQLGGVGALLRYRIKKA